LLRLPVGTFHQGVPNRDLVLVGLLLLVLGLSRTYSRSLRSINKYRVDRDTRRKSAASMIGRENVKTVQERLGHSTADLTLNTYTHLMAGSQAGAAEKMEKVWAAAQKARKGNDP
jgi:integrase